MELFLDYDPHLFSEAEIASEVIRSVFNFKLKVRRRQHLELLTFDEDHGVYRTNFLDSTIKTVYLTGNQILTTNAKSREDFLFGVANPKTQTVIVSLARLRSLNGEDSSVLEITKSLYQKRIKHLVVHEIGHWAVIDQLLYDENVNSIFDQGPHCRDNKCVMYSGNTLRPKNTYREYFCASCRKSLLKD